CELRVDAALERRPAAGRVDVLDAQQEAAAGGPRHIEVEQRRERVAEMQVSGRRRRKAGKGWRHWIGFATLGLLARTMAHVISTDAELATAMATLIAQ